MKRFPIFTYVLAMLASLAAVSATPALAQYQDHTWNPNWGAPYNPGIIVQDNRPRGYWEYQWYYIQTKNTNGFIIVYYNLVCAGAGKRCPSTGAASQCLITGYGIGSCAEGENASIPRNF